MNAAAVLKNAKEYAKSLLTGGESFSEAINSQVNEYLAKNQPYYEETFTCTSDSVHVTTFKVEANVEYIIERRTGTTTAKGGVISVLAYVDGYANPNVAIKNPDAFMFTPNNDGYLAFKTIVVTSGEDLISIRVFKAEDADKITKDSVNKYPLITNEDIKRGYYLFVSSNAMKESSNVNTAYLTLKVQTGVTYIINHSGFSCFEIYEDGSFNYISLPKDGTNAPLEYTAKVGVKEIRVTWWTNKNYDNGVTIKGLEEMTAYDTTDTYASEEQSTEFTKTTNIMPILYAHAVEAHENGRYLKQTVLDTWKYPLYPTWGNEYLAPWYEKLFNIENVTIVFEGDSITQGEDGGYREKCVQKIMSIGGYPSDSLTIVNNGKGSRSTNEWVGTGEHYVYSSDATDFPNGILDFGMSNNPDLLICAYGINDANVESAKLTMEERIALFETNYREALDRIRGNEEINGRPAYNRGDEDLSIILCMPTTVYESTNYKTRHKQNWHIFIKDIIQKLCREYHCAFADFSMFMYDHTWSNVWGSTTQTPPELHPSKSYSLAYNSILQPLIYPIGLWNK